MSRSSVHVGARTFDSKLYVAVYRGHRTRKKVAEDKIKAKVEASVVQLQAGETGDPRRARHAPPPPPLTSDL